MAEDRLELWERRQAPVLRAIPYFMLAVSTPLALVEDSSRVPVTLGLAALAAAWLLATQTRGPRLLHYAGLLAVSVVLTLHSPLFGFFAFTGYLAADALPGRWMYAGVSATAVVVGTTQVGGWPLPEGVPVAAWLGVVAINVIVASGLVFFGTLVEQRNLRLQATLAENAELHERLVTQAREAGVQDERERMAREIHDTLAQGLAGIISQLEAADHARERGADAQRHLQIASRLARESLGEARRSVRAVGPAALEGARLPEALGEVARRWTALHGVEAAVTTTGTARPMHADVDVTLLRTAQEALANVARHAHATRVGLTLSYMEDVVTLDVRDDGVGFTPNGHGGGFGLTAMRQRVALLSGRLEVESEPGRGTAISASVPAVPAP